MTRNDLNRRDFLRSSAAGAGAFALAPTMSPLSGMSVQGDNKILVVLQLSGGNDGLNTVVPVDNDDYHKVRRSIRHKPEECLKLADGVAFSPALKGMRELFDDGDLSVLQGVGYPKPNRSHFKSMDIWHSADNSDAFKTSGWLGRLGDLATAGAEDPDYTINLAKSPPLALSGKSYRPISFQDPNKYRFVGSENEMSTFKKIAESGGNMQDGGSMQDDILALVGKISKNAHASSLEVRKAASAYRTSVNYGQSSVGSSLRTITALINAGLSTRVFYAYHKGFDTHTNQESRHNQLMGQMDAAISGFQKDLRRLGLDKRVVMMVFSEFGRRVKENGSRGTDHGTAGPMFMVGTPIAGGIHGEMPSLTDLDRGDLKFNTDFRSVYATVLQNWLQTNPAKVLGKEFPQLNLFG